MQTWITSDQHFGHANIIKYCNRPFVSADEMDNELALAWNRVVSDNDVVYHLGDFTLGGVEAARKYFSLLNGSIYILCMEWHHDQRWIKETDGRGCIAFHTKHNRLLRISPTKVIRHGANHIHLCHYPLREWDQKYRGAFHFHGHQHASKKEECRLDTNMLNVGVDSAAILLGEYRPFLLDEAIEKARNSGADNERA